MYLHLANTKGFTFPFPFKPEGRRIGTGPQAEGQYGDPQAYTEVIRKTLIYNIFISL